ncbi:MAG: HupE/UreJ family protein [Acidobacteriaceae bacterium]|nr:HupE/UreJ family protein [Acidobacteriaceae bacterium]
MKTKLGAAAAVLLLGMPVLGHRLDEYLQATIFSVEKDRIQVSMRLIPGVAVSSAVLTSIDSNGDGIISEAEGQIYARRVLADLSLSVDGHPLRPRLVSANFPSIEDIKGGVGAIHIEFSADVQGGGSNRQLTFENRHESPIAAYLVNCLVPRDRNIQISAQKRNENQSFYELDYVQAAGRANPLSAGFSSGLRGSLGAIPSMFRLGMRHIAQGTDHLLFLLALLLPAPLTVVASRWDGFAGVRHGVVRILSVVTAFTVGHSITLALAALGLIRVPSRPIEVLIALSIFVSAAHGLRPLFPGRESAIAAFFGLIHGLAFATTLGQLGLRRWERVTSILGFNLGIETMQLLVVLATMPSLVLLSRTRAYPVLRSGGALFAGFASLGWIGERLFGLHDSLDPVVSAVAQHAVGIAILLFVTSLFCCSIRNFGDKPVSATERYGRAVHRTLWDGLS